MHPQGELIEDKGFMLLHGSTQQFFATKKDARATIQKMHDMDSTGGAAYYIVKATRLAHDNHLRNWRNQQSQG